MDNKLRKILAVAPVFLLVCILFCVPVLTHSAETAGGGTGITYECGEVAAGTSGNCDFNDLIIAIQRVTNYGAEFALLFSVVVIAVAGAKYMTSGENAGERTKANKMLISVVKGIALILAAWLIVTLITNALVPGVVTFGM